MESSFEVTTVVGGTRGEGGGGGASGDSRHTAGGDCDDFLRSWASPLTLTTFRCTALSVIFTVGDTS